MASIRARLTVAYGVALVVALAAFSVAVWFARGASATQELGRAAALEAERVANILSDAKAAGSVLTAPRTDSVIGRVVQLAPELVDRLDRFGGYFVVLDDRDRLLFASYAVRRLSAEGQSELTAVAIHLEPGGEAALVPMPGDSSVVGPRLLLVGVRHPDLEPDITKVVSAVPTRITDLAPQLLMGTMLVVLPFILIASLVLAYVASRGTFRPLDSLMDELGAITDGRSLHRRLPVDPGNDELTRLASTLNAMIARLESSFAGLRRFTADASHELKTPLAVLRADVERAMNPSAGAERMVALEEALQEVARMSDLVDSLLTLARADEGRFDLHREEVPLEPLVRDVFETATILGEEMGLKVGLAALEPATVMGDGKRLRQLFLNLITNAIKYTPRGGQVDVSLRAGAPGQVAFSVRDTGIGISAADLPQVFDRFWRADRARSRTSERGGSGLGLAISQWIAHAHGGQLLVQSRLGRGSVFTAVLPAATGTPDGTGLVEPSA